MISRPNIHISIEGMDGVGKTTTSTILAEKLGFTLVEKPLHYLFDEESSMNHYLRIRDHVNEQENKVFTSWFYGLGNIYLYHKFKGQNIVTDRHLLSNYCWSGAQDSEVVFNTLTDVLGQPDYTFILEADQDIVKERLISRQRDDPDVLKVDFIPEAYRKMKEFVKRYGMRHAVINTTSLSREEVCEIIIGMLREEGII